MAGFFISKTAVHAEQTETINRDQKFWIPTKLRANGVIQKFLLTFTPVKSNINTHKWHIVTWLHTKSERRLIVKEDEMLSKAECLEIINYSLLLTGWNVLKMKLKDIWSHKLLYSNTHYGGTNTGTHPSFISCKWQFVWLLKHKVLHSLLPSATYI